MSWARLSPPALASAFGAGVAFATGAGMSSGSISLSTGALAFGVDSVSYTHLTLPTIYPV